MSMVILYTNEIDRQTDRQIDRQTDRQTDGQKRRERGSGSQRDGKRELILCDGQL